VQKKYMEIVMGLFEVPILEIVRKLLLSHQLYERWRSGYVQARVVHSLLVGMTHGVLLSGKEKNYTFLF